MAGESIEILPGRVLPTMCKTPTSTASGGGDLEVAVGGAGG